MGIQKARIEFPGIDSHQRGFLTAHCRQAPWPRWLQLPYCAAVKSCPGSGGWGAVDCWYVQSQGPTGGSNVAPVDADELRRHNHSAYRDGQDREHLKQTVSLLSELIQNFLQDSETGLRQTKTSCNELFDTLSAERSIYYQMANTQYKANKNDFDARYCYYRIYTNMREVGRSLQSLAKLTTEHIANRHRIYTGDLRLHLEELSQLLIRMTDRPDGRGDLASLKQNAGLMIEHIDALQAELLRKIPEANLSVRGCELYLSFLLFAREFINHYEITAVLEEKLNLLPRNSSDQ